MGAVRLAILTILAALTCAACGGLVSFTIKNESPETWMVKQDLGPSHPGQYSIWRVEPGADGGTFITNSSDTRVELLTSDCISVGFFETDDASNLSVPGIEGVSARFVGYPFGQDSDLVVLTPDCGGTVNV